MQGFLSSFSFTIYMGDIYAIILKTQQSYGLNSIYVICLRCLISLVVFNKDKTGKEEFLYNIS